LDYRALSTSSEIAAYASVHSSSMTGRLISPSRARKWAPWNIAANSGALIERSDGTAQFFVGNGAGTGKIYQLSDTQLSDDGAASFRWARIRPGRGFGFRGWWLRWGRILGVPSGGVTDGIPSRESHDFRLRAERGLEKGQEPSRINKVTGSGRKLPC